MTKATASVTCASGKAMHRFRQIARRLWSAAARGRFSWRWYWPAGADAGRREARARFSHGLLVAFLAALAAFPLDAAGFRLAEPGYTFRFPFDHGSHPEYRTEWWYTTGHLTTASGHRFGFELTFFRVGVNPKAVGPPATAWDLHDLGLAHFAITDVDGGKFRYYEKLNRFSPYTAGAATERLDVFNEGWRLWMKPDGTIRLVAAEDGDALDLVLHSRKPPVIHGENGVSIKAEGKGYASHYYSLTRIDASGTIRAAGKQESCTGIAWMDHEFGSSTLRENQAGWDWYSVQLDNDSELMLYIMRRKDGTPDTTSSGSLVLSDGSVVPLHHGDFRVEAKGSWKSPRSGAVYPMGWKITVPSVDLSLDVREELKDQELITAHSTRVTYWEGSVVVDGRQGTSAVTGVGYVEMTGYDKPFKADDR